MREKIERKGKKKRVLLVLVIPLLLLLSSVAYAQTFTEAISELIIEPFWRASYLSKVWIWTSTVGLSFARHVDTLILFNPSPSNNPMIANLMGSIIKLVLPLYILALLLNAFYLMFMTGSPGGRSKVKQAILRIFISMVIFSLSPLLLTLLMQFSESLTEAAFAITGVKPITKILEGGLYGAFSVISWITMADFGLGANPWSYSLYFMAWFPYIFIGIRYIVVSLLAIVFPLSIFLYSFNFSRGVGRVLVESTITWVLLQFFWALVLVAVVLSAGSLRDAFVSNPSLGGINLPVLSAIPYADWIINWIFGNIFQMGKFPGFQTDIFTLIIGIVGYGMIAALPFGMMALFRGYLP